MAGSKLPAGMDIESPIEGVVISRDRYHSDGGDWGKQALTPTMVKDAERLAFRGYKLPDISRKMRVPESTLRKWLTEGDRELMAIYSWIEGGRKGEQPKATMRLCMAVALFDGRIDYKGILLDRAYNASEKDGGIAIKLLRIADPKRYSDLPSSVVDDETGEETATGSDVLAMILGKIAAMRENADDG